MKQGPNDCYEKGKSFTVAIGWTDCELFPEELILNLLLAGETFNSFRMEGIKYIILVLVRKYINWTFEVNTREEVRNIFLGLQLKL